MYQFTDRQQAEILAIFNKSQIYYDLKQRYTESGYENIDNAAVALFLVLGSSRAKPNYDQHKGHYKLLSAKIPESNWVDIFVEVFLDQMNSNSRYDFSLKVSDLEKNMWIRRKEKKPESRELKAKILRVSVVLRILDFAHKSNHRFFYREGDWCLPSLTVEPELHLRNFLEDAFGQNSSNRLSYACKTNMGNLCRRLLDLFNDLKIDRIMRSTESTQQDQDNSDLSSLNSGESENDDGSWENELFNAEHISPVDAVYASISSNRINEVMAALGTLEEARQIRSRKITVKSRKESRYSLGNDPSLILPQEFAKTPIEFCMDFAEAKLLQKAPPPKSTGKKGDVFALLDVSGSMKNALSGTFYTSPEDPAKMSWAKGILLKMTDQIKSSKRKIYAIPFNNDVWADQKMILDGSKSGTLELLSFQEPFGTTNRERPILHVLTQEIQNIKRADILYITDDVGFSFGNEFLESVRETKKKLGFEIHVILVGAAPNSTPISGIFANNQKFRSVKDAYLGTIADYVVELDALTTAASKLDQLLADKYEN